MSFPPDPEPDERGPVIYVGQDKAGHWLVQDGARRLEGRFVSQSAALSYATGECQIYHADLVLASAPMVPLISFAPVPPEQRAASRSA